MLEPGSADELGMMDLGKSEAPTPSKQFSCVCVVAVIAR